MVAIPGKISSTRLVDVLVIYWGRAGNMTGSLNKGMTCRINFFFFGDVATIFLPYLIAYDMVSRRPGNIILCIAKRSSAGSERATEVPFAKSFNIAFVQQSSFIFDLASALSATSCKNKNWDIGLDWMH
jgi:hypothetical protein